MFLYAKTSPCWFPCGEVIWSKRTGSPGLVNPNGRSGEVRHVLRASVPSRGTEVRGFPRVGHSGGPGEPVSYWRASPRPSPFVTSAATSLPRNGASTM